MPQGTLTGGGTFPCACAKVKALKKGKMEGLLGCNGGKNFEKRDLTVMTEG
ncbi:hypothetical protein BGS_0037 [Beggiatoa sp. SS]|nr:hypothetical protein BGS_0037 [Beggiatoa sp. SS]